MTQISAERKAYQHLRGKFSAGTLEPGSRVSALAVAREIGSSPTPVTQAIRKLESEGWLELVPHLGSFVKRPDLRDVLEMFDFREAIETHAVARAVGRLTEAQLRDLDSLCQALVPLRDRCRERGDGKVEDDVVAQAALADLGFHMLIVRATGNRRMLRMIEDSHLMTRGMALLQEPTAGYWAGNLASTYEDHSEILLAIRLSDRKAVRRAMAKHLRASVRLTREHFKRHAERRGTAEPAGPSSVFEILSRVRHSSPNF